MNLTFSLLGFFSLLAFIYCVVSGMAGLAVLFFVACIILSGCELGSR